MYPCVAFDIEGTREIVAFPVSFPEALPDTLELESIFVSTDGETALCTDPNAVEVVLRLSDGSQASRFKIYQRSYPVITNGFELADILHLDGRDIRRLTTSTSAGQMIVL